MRGFQERAISPSTAESIGSSRITRRRPTGNFDLDPNRPGKVGNESRGKFIPGLKWHRNYDVEGIDEPRVFMMDYIKDDIHRKKVVVARELASIEAIKNVYKSPRGDDVALRVFHVQNCGWGSKFLLRKFKLEEDEHAEFARWVKDRHPPTRGGRPLMSAKTWRTQSDPWRGVSKTAFGVDYMKHYNLGECPPDNDTNSKILGLQGYGQDETPIDAYTVYTQRLSVYIQYKIPNPDPEVDNLSIPPHPVSQYDNGTTIIIFDNSNTQSVRDTLISAQGEWESKWRRLPFHVGHGTHPEDSLNVVCIHMILQDLFKSMYETWEKLLGVSWEHVSIMEERIYEQPADESRAPELWRYSAHWLRYEKLMFYHIDTVSDMKRFLTELTGGKGLDDKWFDEALSDFEKIQNLIQEDLVKPTANLSELMYRSVGIRDSRASLQLGTSMWRLSWITFIFLPATFIVSFFGMNVNIFQDNPSIKWFFIAVIPFAISVLLGWYLLKHLLARHRRGPAERGFYENLFIELQETNPNLWTRQGPKDYIPTGGWRSRLKWKMIQRWTEGKNIPKQGDQEEPIGAWNRVKRYLIRKWSREIENELNGGKVLSESSASFTEDLELARTLSVGPKPGKDVPVTQSVMSTQAQSGHGGGLEIAEAGERIRAVRIAGVEDTEKDSDMMVEERLDTPEGEYGHSDEQQDWPKSSATEAMRP